MTRENLNIGQPTPERMEDELAARDLQEAVNQDDGERISWFDLKQDLGLRIEDV